MSYLNFCTFRDDQLFWLSIIHARYSLYKRFSAGFIPPRRFSPQLEIAVTSVVPLNPRRVREDRSNANAAERESITICCSVSRCHNQIHNQLKSSNQSLTMIKAQVLCILWSARMHWHKSQYNRFLSYKAKLRIPGGQILHFLSSCTSWNQQLCIIAMKSGILWSSSLYRQI